MDVKLVRSLLEQMVKGDQHACVQLYEGLYRLMYSVAFSYLNSPELSEDVIHDVFVLLQKNPLPVLQAENPRAYLLAMVKNLSISLFRREIRHEAEEDTRFTLPDTACLQAENRVLLEEMLGILDETDRRILLLHLLSGFKFREISALIQMPMGTVLWRYNRAIGKIRKKFPVQNL